MKDRGLGREPRRQPPQHIFAEVRILLYQGKKSIEADYYSQTQKMIFVTYYNNDVKII